MFLLTQLGRKPIFNQMRNQIPRLRKAVIIPAYNVARTISNVVTNVRLLGLNVIVVNDGSTDRTKNEASDAGAYVVNSRRNFGYSHAVISGLKVANEGGAQVYITIDGDDAHDPDDIIPLIKYHSRNRCDLTIGNRFSGSGSVFIPSTKRWANFVAAALVNFALKTDLQDVACGLRVFSRNFVNEILKHKIPKGFSNPYLQLVYAKKSNMRIGDFPVNVRYDATELLATSIPEMLDLLDVVRKNAKTRDYPEFITRFHDAILNHKPTSFCSDGVVICLIPLGRRDLYILQAQNPAFIDTAQVEFNMDMLI